MFTSLLEISATSVRDTFTRNNSMAFCKVYFFTDALPNRENHS